MVESTESPRLPTVDPPARWRWSRSLVRRHRRLLHIAGVVLAACAPVGCLLWVLTAGPSDGTVARPGTYPTSRWSGGLLITSDFLPEGPRGGDRVIAVDGVSVEDWLSGHATAVERRVGDRLTYTVIRDGQHMRVDVELTTYPLVEAARQRWAMLAFAATMIALGTLVVLSRSADPAARALSGISVLLPIGLAAWPFSVQIIDLVGGRGIWPQVLGSAAWSLVWAQVAQFALLFPEPPPPRSRRLFTVAIYLTPGILYLSYLGLALPQAHGPLVRLERLVQVSAATQRLAPLIIVGLVVWAYRRTTEPAAKRRARWVHGTLLLAVGASSLLHQIPAAFSSTTYLPWGIEPLLYLVCAVSMVAGILRHRLFDIQVIVRRSLVYGALTVLFFAACLLTVVVLDLVVPRRPTIVTIAVGAAVALALNPLRVWLSRRLGQVMFGQRDNPFEVVSRLARVGAGEPPPRVLSGVVQTLAHALRMPFAQVEVRAPDGTVLSRATYGEMATHPVRVPLAGAAGVDGHLLLDSGPGREPFGSADTELLHAVAVHVGSAIHTAMLAEELQKARERLVVAREEERRRLQRDLHDGVGPTLASVAMQAGAALDLIGTDRDAARRAIKLVADWVDLALTDIRRIVFSLGPPALDQLGLVASLRERAEAFRRPSDSRYPQGFETAVVAGDRLDNLPAAVETAVFSIVLEAISNAARHAAASRCMVGLSRRDDVLHVEVRDDGRGISEHPRAGVGLKSMRERAAELGGECEVKRWPTGPGTVVYARLPLPTDREGPTHDR
jgi:two-component system, NarL family, sensor kinase